MVKIDLITGFLGSGKTTFLKKYASYLMEQGQNIGILENDFGAVNIDMMLLQDLRGDNCELEMVSGGCDKDCHKRRFKTKLISMAMCGYDRVLVEPSGIFDIDEFFDTLYEEPLDRWYQIGNVITIVDAHLEDSLSPNAEYFLASEAVNAGSVVLSHTSSASLEDLKRIKNHLNRAMESIKCNRRFEDDLICKDWSQLTKEDFAKILSGGYHSEDYEKRYFDDDEGFQSLYYMNLPLNLQEVKTIAEKLLEEKSFGNVFRVKGFVKESGQWYELNVSHTSSGISPVQEGQAVVIVIGEELDRDKIKECFGAEEAAL